MAGHRPAGAARACRNRLRRRQPRRLDVSLPHPRASGRRDDVHHSRRLMMNPIYRNTTMRILKTIALSLALLSPATAFAEQAILYKNPQCGCCEGHAEHLRANGIDVTSLATHDLALKRQEQSVPMDLVGCHMLMIDGYVVEGHVSAATIKRLLAER